MNAQVKRLSAQEFASLRQQQNCTIIDVRSGTEYRSERLPDALHIPLQDLPGADEQLGKLDDKAPLYLLCQSGKRAESAAEVLSRQRDCQLVVIEGGLNALKEHNVAVERSKSGLSLERQVRIAAGFLALLGVVLGTLLHPAGYVLSAFVGAGLMVAGITNWCGMALLLARMPWNR